MSRLLKFYVKIILNNDLNEILNPLNDIHIKVGDFLIQLTYELKKQGDNDFGNLIKNAINSKNISCQKKPCNLNSKFIDLLSKVEKIDGNEVDVFELRVI